MRYKKGSKVEVWSKVEMPSGSWCRAEIICGNGHTYTIRYDKFPGASDKAGVKRVPRKLIRPCPPLMELSENWFPGDVVEVLHNYSWKVATVSRVLGQNYLVRLVGSSHEIEVSKRELLRVQQYWQDGEWIVFGKNCGDGKHKEQSNWESNCKLGSQIKRMEAKMSLHARHGCVAAERNYDFQESHIVSSRTLKRGSPCCYSQAEAYEGTAQKFRLAEDEGVCHQVLATNRFFLHGKVDAASTTEMLGEKFMHVPLKKKTNGFSEMDVEQEKTSGNVGCSRAISLEPNDADDIPCSVGSCSVSSYSRCKLPHHFSTGPVDDTEEHCSDAESICWLRCEQTNCLFPNKEELEAEIHRARVGGLYFLLQNC